VLIFLMLVKIRFVSIVNLIADEELQLERLQINCTPKALSKALMQLHAERKETASRVEKAFAVARDLGAEGVAPSAKAAHAVLTFLGRVNSANAASSAAPDCGTDGSPARPQAIHA
jgi:lipid A disaccharide synthetase